MSYPSFSAGEVLNAADMNAVGLWLVKSQTIGTGVSSVTVTGAFSADYDNYKILYTGGTASTTQSTNMTLGATAANYSNTLIYGPYGGGAVTSVGVSAGASWSFVGYQNTNSAFVELEMYSPFLTRNTMFASNHIQFGGAVGGRNQGILIDNTSYTSFTFTPAGGTFTGGTIYVYGYKK
jgi:hypothetical protein